MVRAPVFQRLIHAIGHSRFASDDFKKDPIVKMVLHPDWRIARSFPSDEPAQLAVTFTAVIREFAISGLVNHLKTLTTLGHVASVLIASSRSSDDDGRNPRIVEVQELSEVCLALCSEGRVVSSATFVRGPSASNEYVQFDII